MHSRATGACWRPCRPIRCTPIRRPCWSSSTGCARRTDRTRTTCVAPASRWRRSTGCANGSSPRRDRAAAMRAEDAGRPPVIDADGHVLEPPGLWERYVDPAWRARAIRVVRRPDGGDQLLIDGRPARLTTAEMLGGFGGMGRSLEDLAAAC